MTGVADQFAEILAMTGVERIYGIVGDGLNDLNRRSAGTYLVLAPVPTLNRDFPRVELQIEPSTLLVGIDRSSTLEPVNLSGQNFTGDEESHG